MATTAGTAEKVGTAKAFLGADIAINYAEEDFPESLRAQNGGKGADVILDVVGAKYLAQNVDALADYGRLVVIGLQGGAKGELDLGKLLSKRAAIIATALRPRPVAEKAVIMDAVRDAVWPLLTDGRIRPLVAKTFPLDQVVRGAPVLRHRRPCGKDPAGHVTRMPVTAYAELLRRNE